MGPRRVRVLRRQLLRNSAVVAGLALGSGVAARTRLPASAQHPEAGNPALVFRSGSDGYSCYRTPGVAISRGGTLLAFCGGRVDDCRDEGNIDIVLRRSGDGGRSWGPLQVIASDGLNPCKIPCPVVLPGGRILLLWLWNPAIRRKQDRTIRRVMITHSDDDGRSWAPSRDITDQVNRPEWRWYGLGPGHSIVKQLAPARGRIVVPARHGLREGVREGVRGGGGCSHLILSDDGGSTWRIGAQSQIRPSSECTVAELGGGGLMLNSRGSKGFRLVNLSRDGGLTMADSWVERQLVEPRRGCQAALITHGLDPTGERATLLFSNPADPSQRSNGRLRISDDNGRRWSRGLRYSDPWPAFSGYSDLAVFADGDVAVLFESGADAAKNTGAVGSGGPGRRDRRHDGIAFRRLTMAAIRAAG
jgi:sialidase-1